MLHVHSFSGWKPRGDTPCAAPAAPVQLKPTQKREGASQYTASVHEHAVVRTTCQHQGLLSPQGGHHAANGLRARPTWMTPPAPCQSSLRSSSVRS